MKTVSIVYRQKALEDIAEIVRYLALQSPKVAWQFKERLEETTALLAQVPEIGVQRHFKHPDLADVRFVPLKQFKKYLLFYQRLEDNLHIIRVVHGARDLPMLFG